MFYIASKLMYLEENCTVPSTERRMDVTKILVINTFSSSSRTAFATSPFCSKSSSRVILGTWARTTMISTRAGMILDQCVRPLQMKQHNSKTYNHHQKHKLGSALVDFATHRKHHQHFL